jgi:hypothetical protein
MNPAPILIVAYKRPDHLVNLLQTFSTSLIDKIYFFVDGPDENPDNVVNYTKVCSIVHNFKNANHIFLKINTVNLGCKESIESAIDWVLQSEKSVIVLEDDLIIDSNFLNFATKELLNNSCEKSIFGICGSDVTTINKKDAETYSSIHFSAWGWATWQDRWQIYRKQNTKRSMSFLFGLNKFNYNIFYTLYFLYNLKLVKQRKLDTWDFQLSEFLILNNLKLIYPNRNLIINDGFGDGATHTNKLPNKLELIQNRILSHSILKNYDSQIRKHSLVLFITAVLAKLADYFNNITKVR